MSILLKSSFIAILLIFFCQHDDDNPIWLFNTLVDIKFFYKIGG
jgi:hypothetical protein